MSKRRSKNRRRRRSKRRRKRVSILETRWFALGSVIKTRWKPFGFRWPSSLLTVFLQFSKPFDAPLGPADADSAARLLAET